MEQQEWAAKLGVGILTLNSGLAIYGSRGDAASVAFVLAAYAALVLLLLLCLRKLERGGGHGGGEGGAAARRIRTSGAYSALAKVGLAMVTCNTALDTYDARRDAVSAALVAASYAALVILTGLFARAFARAQAQD